MIAATRDREDLASFLLRLRSAQVIDPRLLQAVEAVPRRLFVPPNVANAYHDRSLPIECGETMPGAMLAVWLVRALNVEPTSRILEIGTGSGYVTALLARLGASVVTLDRYRRLLATAEERLKGLGIANVIFRREDGRTGDRLAGPFDRIIVHAAFEALPKPFVEQLAPHGCMICAIGPAKGVQTLVRLRKVGSRFERDDLADVRWQPLGAGLPAIL